MDDPDEELLADPARQLFLGQAQLELVLLHQSARVSPSHFLRMESSEENIASATLYGRKASRKVVSRQISAFGPERQKTYLRSGVTIGLIQLLTFSTSLGSVQPAWVE